MSFSCIRAGSHRRNRILIFRLLQPYQTRETMVYTRVSVIRNTIS